VRGRRNSGDTGRVADLLLQLLLLLLLLILLQLNLLLLLLLLLPLLLLLELHQLHLLLLLLLLLVLLELVLVLILELCHLRLGEPNRSGHTAPRGGRVAQGDAVAEAHAVTRGDRGDSRRGSVRRGAQQIGVVRGVQAVAGNGVRE